MEKSKLIGIAGGALDIISTFLPFVSFMGIGVTLMATNAAQGGIVIGLAAIGAGLLFKGGKTMSIIALVAGILGLALSLYWLSKAGGMAGTGLYIMPVGFLLIVVGGVMGMKQKPANS